MTTISRHTYTAENDLGTEVSLTAGAITLDSGQIPHAEADITLAVEDAALLDELDPRDSRRIIIGATRNGHAEHVYSAWVEQRRNLAAAPRPSAYATSGWSASAGLGAIAEPGWVGGVLTGTTTPYIFSSLSSRAYAAGEQVTLSIRYRVTALAGAATHVTVRPHQRTGNIYYAAAAVVRPIVVGQDEDVVIQWTTPVAIPVGNLDIAVLGATAGGALSSAAAGFGMRATRAFFEDGWTLGEFFDGGTAPAGALERTRWLGAADASPSVLETRTILDTVWVPEGFRYFDLGIRETRPNRADGTVQLRLASDEAILSDFAQLVDDKTPRTFETSVRAVCDYVLSKIGAALEAGSDDADVTAYWEVTNQIPNPSMETDIANWLAGTGASGLVRSPAAFSGAFCLRFTAAAGVANVVPATSSTDRYAVTPGHWYVFAFYGYSVVSRQMRAAIQWWTSNGTVLSSTSLGTAAASSTSTFQRYWVIAKAPAGATHAFPYVNTTGNAAGNNHYVDAAMFYEGDELVPYYDGSTPADAHYTYEWQAAVGGSASSRLPIVERRPEALIWDAGTSGMDFLQPLLMSVGLRLVCDEQRQWTLRSEEYRSTGSQSWRYGINITAADENLSRDDDSWFDAAVYVYRWTDRDGTEQTRTDAFSLSATPTKVLRRELETAYPGPGRAQHVVTRAQGKGRSVSVAGIPTWNEHTDQPLTIMLDGTPIQTGISSSVRFDLDTDTVTIASRTSDTPADAIDLLPGTINALTGTINDL